jgi:transposase
MMGRREGGQSQFFCAFDLDKVVPPDHLVRQIDGVLDLDWVHQELAPYYSHTGRPSIDPVLMIRMLIVGYVFAIRSERRLCSEVRVNLAYRWFCKLGIEDVIPDHSVFSRARHERFRQSEALRLVFEGVVAKCIAAGLVGGEGFSIDASLIKADVDKKKRSGTKPLPPHLGHCCSSSVPFSMTPSPLQSGQVFTRASLSLYGPFCKSRTCNNRGFQSRIFSTKSKRALRLSPASATRISNSR